MRRLETISIALIALFFIVSGSLAYADHAININTADAEQLETLTGIGEVKAQNIIDYRQTNGSFSEIKQIQDVSGIGPATYEDIKNHIVVDDTSGSEQDTQKSDEDEPQTATSSVSSSDSDSGSSTSEQTVSNDPPTQWSEKRISADAGADRTVAVGAPVVFSGIGYGFQGRPLARADYTWNFGDGGTGRGEEKIHFYQHTGTYVVVLTVTSGPYTATDRAVVTVKEPDFLVTAEAAPVSLITIENNSTEEMDLSGWIITAGEQEFVLPEHTIALPDTEIQIPKEVTYFALSEDVPVVLHYPNGIIATAFHFPRQSPPRVAYSTSVSSSAEEGERTLASSERAATSTHSTSSAPAAVGTLSGSQSDGISHLLWWVVFGVLAVLAAGATVFVRRIKDEKDEEVRSLADEFEIVED